MFDEKKHQKSVQFVVHLRHKNWVVKTANNAIIARSVTTFTGQNEGVSKHNQFVWFRKWIMERQVYKYLIRDSGMSQGKLQRLFSNYLKSPPKNLIKSKSNVHLLIDGTYFFNGLCLILYYDYDIQYVQLFRETNNEKYKEIKEDLESLKKLGVDVYSVTCDGHKAILKAVAKVYPNAVIQRCLVHVKRQIKNYLSSNPKLVQSKELLAILPEGLSNISCRNGLSKSGITAI